jgi:small subunit ribosomal protein S8
MSLSDPIADMFNRIRNAQAAGFLEIELPSSRMKDEIVRILKREGYVQDYSIRTDGARTHMALKLKYDGQGRPVIRGLRRISRPGLRRYARHGKQPRILRGMGIAIMSTSAGVMTDHEARKKKIGGEVIGHVW